MGVIAGGYRRLRRTTGALLEVLWAVDKNADTEYKQVWTGVYQWTVKARVRAEYGAYWSSDGSK
jgi:hypothetical protein